MSKVRPENWLEVRLQPKGELMGWLSDRDASRMCGGATLSFIADADVIAGWRDDFSAPPGKLLSLTGFVQNCDVSELKLMRDPRSIERWVAGLHHPAYAKTESSVSSTLHSRGVSVAWLVLKVELETYEWLFDRDEFVPFTDWRDHEDCCAAFGVSPLVDPKTKRPYAGVASGLGVGSW